MPTGILLQTTFLDVAHCMVKFIIMIVYSIMILLVKEFHSGVLSFGFWVAICPFDFPNSLDPFMWPSERKSALVCEFPIDPPTQAHEFTRSSLPIGGSFCVREQESTAVYCSMRFLQALTNTNSLCFALLISLSRYRCARNFDCVGVSPLKTNTIEHSSALCLCLEPVKRSAGADQLFGVRS